MPHVARTLQWARSCRCAVRVAFAVVGCAAMLATAQEGPGDLAPALAVVQNAVPPGQRTMAGAILLFVLNLVGLGGGPIFLGRGG